MAITQSFIKLTYGGSVAGEDVWSNSFNLETALADSAPQLFDDLDPNDFHTAANTFYRQSNLGLAAYNTFDYIKLALIGEDGKQIGEPKIKYFTGSINGNGPSSMAPQNSIVVTLGTGVPRGAGSKGRIYLPAGFADVTGSTGKLSTAACESIRDKTIVWIKSINAQTALTGYPAAVSVISTARPGLNLVVDRVSVGNLVDTQRRRRNKLTEIYVEAPLSTP